MVARVIECTFKARADDVRITLPCTMTDAEVEAMLPRIAEVVEAKYDELRAALREIDPRLDLEVFR